MCDPGERPVFALPAAGIFVHVGRLPHTCLDGRWRRPRPGRLPSPTGASGRDSAARPVLPPARATSGGRRPGDQRRRRRQANRRRLGAPVPGRARTVESAEPILCIDPTRSFKNGVTRARSTRGAHTRSAPFSLNYTGRGHGRARHRTTPCVSAAATAVLGRSGRGRRQLGLPTRSHASGRRPRGHHGLPAPGSTATSHRPRRSGAVLAGSVDGVLADHLVLLEHGLVDVPEHLSDDEASTLPCAALTAWHALMTKGRTRPRRHDLVQGTRAGSRSSRCNSACWPARALSEPRSRRQARPGARVGAWGRSNYVADPDWAERATELDRGRRG